MTGIEIEIQPPLQKGVSHVPIRRDCRRGPAPRLCADQPAAGLVRQAGLRFPGREARVRKDDNPNPKLRATAVE